MLSDIEKDTFLKDLYFTKKNFVGRDKLFYLVRKTLGNTDISRRYIAGWLAKQEVNQLYTQRKKATTIRPIITKRVGAMLQMDLIDMSKQPSEEGFKYILNVIDTFSRRVWLQGIETKTIEAVIPELNYIIQEIQNDGHVIKVIQSDNGGEFKINFPTIKHITSKPHSPTEDALVERANGTVRRILEKLLYHSNTVWNDDIILEVENVYNNTLNRSLGMSPDEAYTLGAEDQRKMHVKQKASKAKGYKEIDIKLSVGNKVRTLIPNKSKITTKGNPIWSTEVFTIKTVIPGNKANFTIPRYRLMDSTGNTVKGSYQLSKLLLIPN